MMKLKRGSRLNFRRPLDHEGLCTVLSVEGNTIWLENAMGDTFTLSKRRVEEYGFMAIAEYNVAKAKRYPKKNPAFKIK